MECSIGVFPNEEVGHKTIIFLLENFRDDVKFVVCANRDSMIFNTLMQYNYAKGNIYFNDELTNQDTIDKLTAYGVNYTLLAWWPFIIKAPVLAIPKIGVLNFHPSLLPYNRGRNYNFWTIVEDSPFGVTIHFVDENIDTGDIVFQKPITKDWTDTGETLYRKAKDAMFELFTDRYKDIREGRYERIKQDESIATFRLAKEMTAFSKIELDLSYTARDLINLFRARTFYPHPGIRFEDAGKTYEVRISINEVN